MKQFLVISAITFFISGCTSIDVKKVNAEKYPISTVCIIKNPKVLVDDFLPVLEKGFNRHGIAVELYSDSISKCCEYSLRYIARRSWDVVPFLAFAELELKQHMKIIGTVQYQHHGGLALTKHAGTESKMIPVIDELLTDFELADAPDENYSECLLDDPSYVPPKKKPQSNSIEIIESSGRIIFSQLPENNRLQKIGIALGDNILSVNGISVNKNNLATVKEALESYHLEISVLGKGTALMRGYKVIKTFKENTWDNQ